VVIISSCEVYGGGEEALKEEARPKPASPYGLSKLCAEEVAKFYHRRYELWTAILRPFNHTGPGQDEIFVFPGMARSIVEMELGKREPLLWVGNLDAQRDYTDVRDVVRAYLLAIEHCEPGETYNITSARAYSIREGVEILRRLAKVGFEVRVDPTRLRAQDIPVLHGDGSKFSHRTGWQPQIKFEETLSDLLEYYRAKDEGR
jgi:GDP-4-dehydro-6-deoxy-D-mannose reductase